jgi:hypothetical protein
MPSLFLPTPADLSGGTLADIYTATDNYTFDLTIVFCNRDSASTTIRLAVAPAGAADANAQYLLFDYVLAANGYLKLDNVSIQGRDVVRAKAGASNKASVNVLVNNVRALVL